MNKRADTAADLVAAATELFVLHGFEGTSVRAITEKAEANLGAITYHFGSKEALHNAVVESVVAPMREVFLRVAEKNEPPLDRIESRVRAAFEILRDNHQFPRILAQHISGSRPMPEAAKNTMQTNIGVLASMIEEGQRDGSIRAGNPFYMALSIGSQPMWLTLAQSALREGARVDQGDPDTHRGIVDSVVAFVREGLATHQKVMS